MRALLRDRRAASAAEFALVLPLLLLFLFGIIDAGRLMWEWNRAEKATQMGVRYAIATNLVPAALATYSYSTSGGIPQGDPVPASSFTGVTCTGTASSATCSWKAGGSSSFALNANADAFNAIVTRMKYFQSKIAPTNVMIDYDYSGLGYAGDPNGPDVAPLVTVRLTGLTFAPITFILFGGNITMPDFAASLTLEDGSGTVAN